MSVLSQTDWSWVPNGKDTYSKCCRSVVSLCCNSAQVGFVIWGIVSSRYQGGKKGDCEIGELHGSKYGDGRL